MTSSLEQHRASRDFRGVGRKHRDDANLRQQLHGLAGGDAGFAHSAQRAAHLAGLGCALAAAQAVCAASALAMVRFRQVDQFKVESEGSRQLFGKSCVAGCNARDGLSQQRIGFFCVALQACFPALRRKTTQIFHSLKQRIASLFREARVPAAFPRERTSRRSGASLRSGSKDCSSSRRSPSFPVSTKGPYVSALCRSGVDSFLRAGLRNFRLLLQLHDEFFPFRKQCGMFEREDRPVDAAAIWYCSAETKRPSAVRIVWMAASVRGISSSRVVHRSCICRSRMGLMRLTRPRPRPLSG